MSRSSRADVKLLAAAAAVVLLGSVDVAAAVSLGVPSAFDTPNDGGRSITVTWEVPADAPSGVEVVVVRVDADGNPVDAGRAPLAAGRLTDGGRGEDPPRDGVPYTYRLVATDGAAILAGPVATPPVIAEAQIFHAGRANVFLILAVFSGLLFFNIWRAGRSIEGFYIRRLAPIDAMDEAIGRATEMGRPVLYVPGIEEVQDIQTIAAMLILERIAEKTATYDVPLIVPTRTPFVLAVADEVVKTGCMAAGRPDAYRPDGIRYISNEQFAYCAGVNGIILRDRPAANFYLGRFFAESLIFAETGFAAGSIQIAGTAEVTQLPFFIAACDYTLIGEEFFAASAYLSRDPSLLSTLKAADWAKVILVTALVVGAVLESFGQSGFRDWFSVAH
jgi:hypothetical protein